MDWHIDWDGADVVIVGPGSVEVVLRGFDAAKLETVGLPSNVLDALGGLAALEPVLPDTDVPLVHSCTERPEGQVHQDGWRYTDDKIDLQCISTWRDGAPDHGRCNILWVGECVSWPIDTPTYRTIDGFFRQQKVRGVPSQSRPPLRGDRPSP